MGTGTRVTIRAGGRSTTGNDARMGLVALSAGIADGSVVEVNEMNYLSELVRGPAVLQARDYFNNGGRRLVVCGIDQDGAADGTMEDPTADGENTSTAVLTSDVSEKPLLSQTGVLEITRVVDSIGRPGKTYAKISFGGGEWETEEFLLDICGGDGDTTPYYSKVFIEQVFDGKPLVADTGNGPFILCTEAAESPENSFVVGDTWSFESVALAPTSAKVKSAVENLHDWRDAYELPVGEELGSMIGLAHPLAGTEWDDVNGIFQDSYEDANDQTFGAVLLSAIYTVDGEVDTQATIDRIGSDIAAYIAALVSGDDLPWTGVTFAYANNNDGEGCLHRRPMIGEALGLMAGDGFYLGRSIGWQKNERKLDRLSSIRPDDLSKDQLAFLRNEKRVIALNKVRGRGVWFDNSCLPAPATSKLTRLQHLRTVVFAATLTHALNSLFRNAPGITKSDLASQQAYMNARFEEYIGMAWEACSIVLEEPADPEADPVTVPQQLTVQPIGSREAFSVDLFLTLGGE
jgi:hypothetical protein